MQRMRQSRGMAKSNGGGRTEGDPGPANPTSDQTTVRRTSTLPRVALEYGHTSCAFATSASASARDRPGSDTARSMSRPKPPAARAVNPPKGALVVADLLEKHAEKVVRLREEMSSYEHFRPEARDPRRPRPAVAAP